MLQSIIISIKKLLLISGICSKSLDIGGWVQRGWGCGQAWLCWQAAAAARSSVWPQPRHDCLDAGLTFLFSKNVDSEKHPGRLNLEDQTLEQLVKHTREVL